jgi:hypothetical protein
MLTDKMIFSNAQAITLSGTTTGTNVLDVGEVANPNLGAGTPIWLYCMVNTTFSPCTGTTATLQAILQDCATSGGTWASILAGYAFSNGEITKGVNLLTVPLPAKHKRYLKLIYTTATGSGWIAGNIDALLTPNAPRTS